MQNKQVKSKFLHILVALIMLVITFSVGQGLTPAFAATHNNTNVLKDLQKDGNFNVADYPDNPKDYAIKVIQVAESDKNELFLYTYQPCQKTTYLVATDINMSLTDSTDDTKLYELILINTNATFAKYLVKGVTVNNNSVRYYNISSVYRAWDNAIDGTTGNNNTGEKKSFPVRSIYRVTTENGEKKYFHEPTYTVSIINPYSDYLIYTDFHGLPSIGSIQLNFNKMGFLDAHYIAFSTDWEIDRLMSATVTYNYRTGTGHYNTFLGFDCGGDLTYENPQSGYAYPTYKEKAEYSGDFWHNGIGFSYSWDRIQTVSEFIATEKGLTEETKTNLKSKQWVLRFLETKRTQTEGGILGYKKYTTNFTKVDRISVLRLEFESDGTTYNLGAVSDTVSGDDYAGNAEKVPHKDTWDKIKDFFKNLFNNLGKIPWWVWLIIALVILSVALPVLSIFFPIFGQILSMVFKAICTGLIWLCKGLFWLIGLPFKGIAALFNRKGKNKGNGKVNSKPKKSTSKKK